MEYESVHQAAERFGVTVRAVQKWAAAGKLPGAEKIGRDWRIPAGASDPREKSIVAGVNIIEKKSRDYRLALPLLNGAFTAGKSMEFINSIPDEDDRNIALGEYYYYTGQMDKAYNVLEPYVSSDDPALRYSAETTGIFINIAMGHTHLARFALSKLDDQVREGLKSDSPIEVHAMGIMTAHAMSVLLHRPIPDVPPLQEYLRFLPGGMKLWGCYILSYKAFQKKNYERALAAADLAMALVPDLYLVPMIYCQLMAVVSLMGLMRVEEAKERFGRMWAMVKADGFIQIIGEHYGSLQGVVDAYFKKSDPQTYEELMKSVRDFGINWIKLYNVLSGKDVANNLTATEFTVATLYNRGWTAQEIASHLELSENTVRSYIKTIYIKLGVSDKKALAQFMIE